MGNQAVASLEGEGRALSVTFSRWLIFQLKLVSIIVSVLGQMQACHLFKKWLGYNTNRALLLENPVDATARKWETKKILKSSSKPQ